MLRNKSKQMGSVAQVVWHDKGGCLKYTVHFSKSGARAMCCNSGSELANLLRHFWKKKN